MRLIDADELMEHAWRDKLDSRELIAKMIDNAPTVKEIPTKIPINVFEQLISQEPKAEQRKHMKEDRLGKTISDIAYILDNLCLLRNIQKTGDCNICKNRDCGYMPKAGRMVRYNCPFYKAESEEL
jgi:hypothetical protein